MDPHTENAAAEKSLLRDRQAGRDEAHLIINRAKLEKRDLTDEENARCESLLATMHHAEARLDQIRGGLQSSTDWGGRTQRQRTRTPDLNWSGQPAGGGGGSGSGLFGSGESVADSMFGAKRDNGGFASFGDFLQTLDSGRFDNRMRAANTTGIDSGGGFLVPEIFQNAFIDAVLESTIIASRCRRFPMTSDTLKISGFDGNDHSSHLFGGLAAAWEEEIPTLSEQSPTTRQISFHARKLMILTQASTEMTTDAPSYENMLGEALVQSTAWQLDYALLRGDGAGKPLGCITADSRVSVAKESSQTAATLWYDNCLKMFSRLHPASYATAIWCCNPTCLPELFTLDYHESATALGSGLVGDMRYEPFKEVSGTFTLFGRPVLVTEKLPVLGQEGDLVLIDPTQYALAMRQEVVVEKSSHAGFVTDSSYYRSKLRCDGQPLWAKAMTPRAGDDLSWCVTLAIRE